MMFKHGQSASKNGGMLRRIGKGGVRSVVRFVVLAGVLSGLIAGKAEASSYSLTSSPLTWTAAEAEAVSLGGHLVAINDAAEQALLEGMFGGERLWIGLTDEASEGTFVWSSGDPVTYTNWAGSEPNNCCAGEDYTHLYESGPWNDLPNDGAFFGVTRGIIEVSSVPEPASLLLIGSGLVGLVGLGGRKTRKG